MSSRSQQFLESLDNHVLVGDGAMGSRLYELGIALDISYDHLNLSKPELVRQVHNEYLKAGSNVLETNTFSANRLKLSSFGLEAQLQQINREGVLLARDIAGGNAFVAGAVGPLPQQSPNVNIDQLSEDDVRQIYREQILELAEAGADVIQLETFSDVQQLVWVLEEVKRSCQLPVVAQLTFLDGHRTAAGDDAYTSLELLASRGADVIGTNCGRGVANVLRVIEYICARTDAKISAYPNAGLPEEVDGRYMYLATPEYLADSAEQMARSGANLIGGCCGTGPADIAAIADRIGTIRPAKRARISVIEPSAAPAQPAVAQTSEPEFLTRLRQKTVVLVELDAPKTTDYQKVLQGAKALKAAGVDAITVGDSPLATLRMDGFVMGAMIQQQAGVSVVCHLACRDRNIIGTQGLLLGAHAQGIRVVLALTGDPAKLGNQPGASSVYDLNSFKLCELISRLNAGENFSGQSIGEPTRFSIGVAFNPNVRNLEVEVRRLKRKVNAGAAFALTQAVFDAETMRRGCEAVAELGIPVFAGVFPLLSNRHAEFLHNEFPGITVHEQVRKRMKSAKGDKALMAAEGMAIARELIDDYREYASGLYLIPPLNRHQVAIELIEHIHSANAGLAATKPL